MELKIFGPSGAPDEEFTKGLRTLFTLEPPGWNNIAEWFLTTDSFNEREGISSPVIEASSLLPEQFLECVYTVRFILEAWQIYGLQLQEIQRDLLHLGYRADEIERLGDLLLRLEPIKKSVYSNFMRSEHENAVLPTLEDIDVVCDIRPIFEDYIFPAPTKGSGVDYKRLLSFSYMVLMELVTEDFEGNAQKLAFQMTEESLADLQSALQRAREQLAILRANTRGLSTERD